MAKRTSNAAHDGIALLWFRRDLRLADNDALHAAVASGLPVLCLYVHDANGPSGDRSPGAASQWWLAQSLRALKADLQKAGADLLILEGDEHTLVLQTAQEAGAAAVFWNRRYEAGAIAVDEMVKTELTARKLQVKSFNSTLLNEPWRMTTKAGTQLKVFSAFERASRALGEAGAPRAAPRRIEGVPHPIAGLEVDALRLEPRTPDWAKDMAAFWTPGENGAHSLVERFADEVLAGYAEGRERPGEDATSRLSPHLRHGEISPRQLWHAAAHAAHGRGQRGQVERLSTELTWREFAYHVLFHEPHLHHQNHRAQFDTFPWRADKKSLTAWQRGQTGYPIVDAGMRQLWQLGWMHNRVRMITASFLIKHLLIDWRQGEAWFWDTLVDADPANNPFNWQWVAGSGYDASPFFRIFNPVTQGERHDAEGDYVRRFVPELAALPAKFIHRPWEAPPDVLKNAKVVLGDTYPRPIVDHTAARERALAALRAMKASTAEAADLSA